MVSEGHVCSIVSSADDVLWMSVVRGMRGVGGVCEMCMCLIRRGVCGEGVSRLNMSFTNPVRTGELLDVCLMSMFRLLWCVWCRWELVGGLDQSPEWYGGVMSV